ncbi:hypothetical protein BGZ92_004127 [Podila epicladia]|nr:hypothetical protein BGZ92_004127 [Podila epicladia]
MKQLSLKSEVRGALSDSAHFICHCPNLAHLEMRSLDMNSDPGRIELLVTSVVKPLLSRLKKLLISGIPDDLMARLWQELPVASCLSATDYGIECHRLLSSPINRAWANQIREINIRGALFSSNRHASEVLMICSGLRKFETSYIDVNDMVLDSVIPVDYSSKNLRPWVCFQLEELRAEFICPSSRSQHNYSPEVHDVYDIWSQHRIAFWSRPGFSHTRI